MKLASAIFWLSSVSLTGFSAPPQLDAIWPPGGQQGTEIEITLSGKLDPWPCQLHFSEKGFIFTPDPEKKGTGKLKIAKETTPGAVLVRSVNEEGVTPPKFFVVGTSPEILEEDADKNTIGKAQSIDVAKLPLVINGKIPANNEIDSFRLSLKKGEALHAIVEGYTLLSLIDPVLHAYDAEGNRLQLEHDSAVHLDPRLVFIAPEDGDFHIAVTAFAHPPAASVYYRGDKKAQYRLHLARKKTDLPSRLFPSDLGPDSTGATLQKGTPIVGTLQADGEIDRISFPAKKGEQWLLRVEAASLGFPTDPVLRLIKPDQSELKLIDDANKEADPEYLWKVAADGDYFVEVSDRFRRGDASFRYRLSASDPEPDFTAVVEKSEYVLDAGKSIDVKVKVTKLHGHQTDLLFEIPGLPASIKFEGPDKVPEKGGDLILKLEATKEAAAFQKELAIQVYEKGKEGKKTGKPKAALFSFKDDNYRGPYLIMDTPSIWLTVPPPKKEEPKTKTEEPKTEKKKE